jgi:hypothetical protein
MQLIEIKISQLNHRPMYSVSERTDGSDWTIMDYGISIDSADQFADQIREGALDAGHSVRCFYEWTDGKRTYRH